MSRILKSSNVKLDKDNAVSIEVMDANELSQKAAENEEERREISVEVKAGQILFNAKAEAENIIRMAQMEAQIIIQNGKEQAEKQAQIIMKGSYDDGYGQGYENGVQEAEGLKQEAERVLEQAHKEREEMITSVEADMVELVIGIVDKLLAGAKEISPQIIIYLIKQGLNDVSITGDIKIHVSQEDIETVTEHKETILSMVDGSPNVEIVKDATLKKFDCIIETAFGDIDCSLDQQYEALRESLYHILNCDR